MPLTLGMTDGVSMEPPVEAAVPRGLLELARFVPDEVRVDWLLGDAAAPLDLDEVVLNDDELPMMVDVTVLM